MDAAQEMRVEVMSVRAGPVRQVASGMRDADQMSRKWRT